MPIGGILTYPYVQLGPSMNAKDKQKQNQKENDKNQPLTASERNPFFHLCQYTHSVLQSASHANRG